MKLIHHTRTGKKNLIKLYRIKHKPVIQEAGRMVVYHDIGREYMTQVSESERRQVYGDLNMFYPTVSMLYTDEQEKILIS